ncbi:SRPBCC family protein [Bailinhaonella thermotolerans]|uniref:SRPBCC family protein n=1 Tax=Bailinhaonella thermotolerans TaxID=1070861 RepID=A0A3A4A5F6_9ACTN|nr:SRPBCC family protein [Bailinhaonella thermotolerans]RJL23039.1 SRPBCC family protein [Bailinhaonella thermotolerans]
MRYADGPGVAASIEVAADPARVWELVADIGLPARFSPELLRVEWLDGAAAPAVGARFAGHNRHPMLGEWRTVSQIVELVPGRVMAWCPMDADGRYGEPSADPAAAMATWRFELEPVPGGTRLELSARIGPGRSGLTLAIERWPDKEEAIVATRLAELRAGIETTLDGIRALAEEPRVPR